MAYTRVWDETRPNGATVNANLIDDEMQYTRVDMRERVAGIFGLTALQFAADPIVPISLTLSTSLTVPTANLASGAITSSVPAINASQTWNAGGVTFTGLKLNVTDSASAAASLLLDLQVGGVSKFSVKKDGTIATTVAISGLTASQAVFTDGSKNLVSNAITGTGNVVMSASPTLTGTLTAAAANFSGAVVNSSTTTLSGALTYGGVTLSNAVTGTGNMVLSASPTFTGTLTATTVTGTGLAQFGSANNPVRITRVSDATGFGLVSFNGTDTRAGMVGVYGQNDNVLRFNVPTGGNYAFIVNNATTALTLDATTATFAGAVSGITTLSMAGLLDVNSNSGIKVRNGSSDGITLLQYSKNSWRLNGLSAGSTIQTGGNLTTLDFSSVTATTLGGSLTGVTTLNMSSTLTNTAGAVVLISSGNATLDLNSGVGSGSTTTYKTNSVLKWQVGLNIINTGRWEIYDSVNSALAISITPGATPAVAFNGNVSGIGALAGTGAVSGFTTYGGVTMTSAQVYSGSGNDTFVSGVAKTMFAVASGESYDIVVYASSGAGGVSRLFVSNNAGTLAATIIIQTGGNNPTFGFSGTNLQLTAVVNNDFTWSFIKHKTM